VLAAEIAGHYAGGFVVDGLVSQHAAPAVVARALAAALGLAKADPAPAVPPEGAGDDWTAPEVWPGGCCSPRHRVPLNSRDEVPQCVG